MKVGYVLKSYPRLSQTFIVNELLAHEHAGLPIEIFSLRPAREEPTHASVAQVRAAVTYLPAPPSTAAQLWEAIGAGAQGLPGLWHELANASAEPAEEVFQALVLARLAREHGITHLHAHFGNVATAVARQAGRFAGIPYSFTAHARDIFHQNVAPEVLRRKLAQAKAVVTVSEFNLDFLRRHYGAAAGRVTRIYNGLDMASFAYASPAGRPPTIVSVGRLVEKKGFPDLIDACAGLAADGREFRCVIVGDGPQEQLLRERIATAGLDSRVTLVGVRMQDEVKRLIQQAAVLAAPCVVGADGDQDGLPTVLLEAMALGTPCVGTDVTGIPEVLRNGETGLMVAQHAPRALAAALGMLLDDAPLRERLAQNARRLMEREFDVHRNTARMRELFAAG
jgi:glycosyltransferase involved in cell wall biosynthesis